MNDVAPGQSPSRSVSSPSAASRAQSSLELAKVAHKGQTDRAGVDYMAHVYTVSENAAKNVSYPRKKDAALAGLLHDAVEDGGCTLDDVERVAGQIVRDAVDALTKRKGERREHYLERVLANPIARAVKLADLDHNMNLLRLPEITKADIARFRRYNDERGRILLAIYLASHNTGRISPAPRASRSAGRSADGTGGTRQPTGP